MANIGAVQQEWQQDLNQFLADKGAATKQYNIYMETMAMLEEKVKQNHGLSRVKNPFIKAVKIAPLHHKQKRLAKHVNSEKAHLVSLAEGALVKLGEAVVQGTQSGVEYNDLKNTSQQVKNTQSIVLNAANQCRSASSEENFAGMDDKNIGMDMFAQSDAQGAARSIMNAQNAVQSLLRNVKGITEVDGRFANDIAGMSSNAFFMDLTGSFMGSFANWDAADKLDNAESHLRSVASELGQVLDNINRDKTAILNTALSQARKSDPAVNELVTSLDSARRGNLKLNARQITP